MGLTRITAQQISNIDYKQAVRVVTTTNITLAGGAPNTVDSVSLVANDRVLVTGQTTGSQNGLYYVTTVGAGSTGTWTRSTDGNNTGEILAGLIVMVNEGTIYADTQWKLTTNDPITIDTTALTFVQNYFANSISSGTSNVSVGSSANVTISAAGTANVLTISSTGTVVSGTESVTGNITGGNILTGGLISATGNITGGNVLGGANVNATTHTGTTVSVTGTITAASVVGGVMTGSSTSVTGTTTAASVVGGVITGSSLSVTGNITGGNVLGGANVNATTHTGTTVSVAGNITGGNILFGSGIISGTGNITGGYFFGNGSQLTGIAGGGGGSSITNGTSNVSVAASGNVTVGVAGTAAVTTFATTGIYVPGLASVTGNVNIGNAAGVTYANAGGVRAWTYYNNATTSIDTVFL